MLDELALFIKLNIVHQPDKLESDQFAEECTGPLYSRLYSIVKSGSAASCSARGKAKIDFGISIVVQRWCPPDTPKMQMLDGRVVSPSAWMNGTNVDSSDL